MLSNIKGAIFDMDGTLIDSMWVWGKIDVAYLSKRNILLPSNLRENIEHLSFDETAEYFKNRFNLTDTTEEIKNEWNDLAYCEYAHTVELKPYVREYLALLKSYGIKIGLATSNCTSLIEVVLKRHNIYNLFNSITTTDEVDKSKNFPDVYLLAAKRLNIAPQNCIVFEDILPAIIGAKAANMKTVAVYDSYSEMQWPNMMNLSDYSIKGYDELIDIDNSHSINSATR